jgi:hypothetical protein
MENKRALADFILKKYKESWDSENRDYDFDKEKIVDILVEYEEENEY